MAPFSRVTSSIATQTVQVAMGGWPVLAVLVPRHFHPIARRFAKHLRAPEDHVGPDDALHQVQHVGVAGEIQEGPVAAHAFVRILAQVRADQLFRPDIGLSLINCSKPSRNPANFAGGSL